MKLGLVKPAGKERTPGSARPFVLSHKRSWTLEPRAPYNFDANLHKPSHFPSSDYAWDHGTCWITMNWRGQVLGLKFQNEGTILRPRIRLSAYSRSRESTEPLTSLLEEIYWRFNFDQDISQFNRKFQGDEFLGPAIRRWRGMKPIAFNSLYETLMTYLVLQNATVRRSVQMLENLFDRFGHKVAFDGKIMSTFWPPRDMAKSSEEDVRRLKVGYRAKSFLRITEQCHTGPIDEISLRRMPRERVERELMKLYGIGPISADGLLFEHFYFLDRLKILPPWERKIMSRLLFGKKLVPAEKIMKFFRARYAGYEKLAFHYLWEDLFWRRKQEHIEWLEREIRL